MGKDVESTPCDETRSIVVGAITGKNKLKLANEKLKVAKAER